jgi:hypothetical protein
MPFTGNWKININTPMGDQENSLSLSENGNQLTGTQAGQFGANEVLNGLIDGNKASWKIEMTQPFAITLEFSAVVDGSAIDGVVKAGAFGESRFKGSRA